MKLNKLGEFGLIERFRRSVRTDSGVIKGSGDDCAVLEFGRDKYQLFTCDMLVEDVDFRKNHDPYLIGRKSIAVSLSDIAACAGVPRHCLVSIGIPPWASVAFLDRLFKGMRDICAKYNLNITGGDISRADKLIIDVSMLGLVEKKNLVLREGAREGDVIFVTGPLGGSIKGKHFKFTPRLKEARWLSDHFKITSMIDISDGLAQDLGHILKASRKGAVIYQDLIPLSRDAKNPDEALFMGEDFELIFTLSLEDARRLQKKIDFSFAPIGQVLGKKEGLTIIRPDGRHEPLKAKGYSHF